MNRHLNFAAGHRTTRFPRRGSTLIVVLALLALLSMLGLALVVFSGSEKTSAENFSASIEREMQSQPRPSGEVLSQFAISRLALGGLATETNSALYGGRHSLVPNLVGRDLYPHNGRGINVITDPNAPGSVRTDQDYDGNADPSSQLQLQISDSPVYEDINGNGQLDQGEDLNGNGQFDLPYSMIRFLSRTDPDVGYTAPDINSAFLSFNGHVHNKDVNQLVHAFTPSFARPQYRRLLVPRNVRSSWETHTSTVRNVLRPHPSRVDFTSTEDANNNGQLDPGEDLNGNGQLDRSEDLNGNGRFDINQGEDLNSDGNFDIRFFVRGYRYVRTLREAQRLGLSGPFPFNADEDLNGDGQLTLYESDLNGNGQFDAIEDLNGNGQWDSGEDQNRNGLLDNGEDINGNGYLELHEDQNQNGVLDSGSRMGVWDVLPLLQSTFYRAGECVQHNNNFYRVMRSGNSGQDLSTYIQSWTRLESPLQPRYQLDADPDGDGVREAVWLDLDFPVQSLGDGRKAVPLFAFTIVDADGLINFNTAGNTSGYLNLAETRGSAQVKFGTEDQNNNSQLDRGEDQNGNGRLDPGEDQNNDGLLDPGEDLNLNGQLDHFISRSNLGMAPSEINPLWALDAGSKTNDQPVDRNTLEMFSDQKIFFHPQAPRTPQENANMEWWFALKGRPITDVGSGNLLGFLPGRHGDIQRLIQAANASSSDPMKFPQPGIPLVDLNGDGQISIQEVLAADDNWNAFEGHGYGQNSFLTPDTNFRLGRRGARRIPFGHPLDFRGSGTLHHLNPTNNRLDPLLYFSSTSNTPGYWLRYWGFHALATINPTIQWGRGLQSGSTSGPLGPLMLNTPTNQFPLVDNQEESIVDSRYRSSDDSLFDTEENFFLQGSERDLESTGVNTRLGSLLSYNLSINNRAKEIRKRFTVNSWDTRNATRPRYLNDPNIQNVRNRPWEFDSRPPAQLPSAAAVWFPPTYQNFTPANNGVDPKDPFRPALRRLLQQTNDPTVSAYEDPTNTLRRLSLNHLVDIDANGQLFYRELADHPVHEDLDNDGNLDAGEDLNNNGILDLFAATALPREWTGYQLDAGNLVPAPSNPQMQQEFQARVDRQRMARDIYVLLYMFCGGQDNVPYHTATNAQRALYTENQLREMAQFAVNLVDSLDRDQVITKFEYDKNLSDGWMVVNPNTTPTPPDDNPFNGDEDTTYNPGNARYDYRYPEDGQVRGVVYGVEAQQLTLSEFLAIRSKKVLNNAGNAGEDHLATAHTDTEDRHYAYIELHNASPHPVSVGGGHWQLVLQPSDTQTPDPDQVRTVILWDNRTLTNGAPIQSGNKFTIGSAADSHTQAIDKPGTTTGEKLHSEFWVNKDHIPSAMNNAAPVRIAPRQTTTNWLDLLEEHIRPTTNLPNGKRRFRVTDGDGTDLTATAGSLLSGVPSATATTDLKLRIVLRRRVHSRRQVDPTNQADVPSATTTNGTLEDNPWVEVDSMIYRRRSQPNSVPNIITNHQDWEFTIKRDDNAAANPKPIENELKCLRARQRVQPFDARTAYSWETISRPQVGGPAQPYWPNSPATVITNSLGATNVLDPSAARAPALWQHHPDRDFASIGELLAIPLSAPWEITNSNVIWSPDIDEDTNGNGILDPGEDLNGNGQLDTYVTGAFRGLSLLTQVRQEDSDDNGQLGSGEDLNGNGQLDPSRSHTAGYNKFLRTRGTSGTQQDGNRWYRLFSFAEVRTRTDNFPSVQLPDYKKFRVPGRINLNTVRHPEVLGALLDEPQLQGLTGQAFMVDTLGVNRWYQFLESRNGLDPFTSLFLPGTPTSQPFRDFGFIYRGEKSIDDTLFRSMPLDKNAGPDGWFTGRRLFDLGNSQTNFLSRPRLLSKIAGNTTTRSNVFHVFLQVSWFEAYRNPRNGNLRIGARLKDAASHRAFFVLDRSRILEHLKPTHLSNNPGDLSVGTGTNGGIEQIDPSTIILHSQVIE